MPPKQNNFTGSDSLNSTQIALFNVPIKHQALKQSSTGKEVDKYLGQFQDKFADYDQLVILFIAGWVISYTLGYKDSSQCLDEVFPSLDFTFRTWLKVNFALSMTVTVLFMLGVLFAVLKEEKFNKLSYPCGVLFILTGITKVIWILAGAVIFVYHLNFDHCSDFIITYCSGQFLVFLSALAYFCIKKLFKLIIKYVNCCGTAVSSSTGNSSNGKHGLEKFINETGGRVKKQLAFWGMIGWIYAMVLAKKDKSICLDDQYEYISITFRQWFWGDGITTLICLFVFTILAIFMKFNSQSSNAKSLFDQLMQSSEWIRKHHVLAVLFICSALFKFVWLLIGLSMFFADLNIQTCKGFMIDYLMFYFVWFIYFGVVMFIIFMDLIAEKCINKKSIIRGK